MVHSSILFISYTIRKALNSLYHWLLGKSPTWGVSYPCITTAPISLIAVAWNRGHCAAPLARCWHPDWCWAFGAFAVRCVVFVAHRRRPDDLTPVWAWQRAYKTVVAAVAVVERVAVAGGNVIAAAAGVAVVVAVLWVAWVVVDVAAVAIPVADFLMYFHSVHMDGKEVE